MNRYSLSVKRERNDQDLLPSNVNGPELMDELFHVNLVIH